MGTLIRIPLRVLLPFLAVSLVVSGAVAAGIAGVLLVPAHPEDPPDRISAQPATSQRASASGSGLRGVSGLGPAGGGAAVGGGEREPSDTSTHSRTQLILCRKVVGSPRRVSPDSVCLETKATPRRALRLAALAGSPLAAMRCAGQPAMLEPMAWVPPTAGRAAAGRDPSWQARTAAIPAGRWR
jgi:hypothetical protein